MRGVRLAFHHSHDISILVIAGELHECMLPGIERSLRAMDLHGYVPARLPLNPDPYTLFSR